MKLAVIDREQYRQYQAWQALQKILLAGASGFAVAGILLNGEQLRLLAQAVTAVLGVLFLYAAYVARSIERHMTREVPASLQSLLLFSPEGAASEEGDVRGGT